MHRPRLRPAALGLALVLLGCSHTEPFATEAPDPLGPPSTDLPRQLTFNPGDDRAPNVAGTDLVFDRLEADADFIAPCIAVLPVEGGTLRGEYCAPSPSPADTFVSSWLEPALSPDGTRLAFVWRRSARVSALSAWTYHLVVSSVDSPEVPLAIQLIARALPSGQRINTARELSWASATSVRFLGAFEVIVKVKDGGASRFTDTATVPRALMEYDLTADTIRLMPGGEGVIAYAQGSSALWIVADSSPSLLQTLAADGTRTAAGTWPGGVTDIAEIGGVLAATRMADAMVRDTMFWLEPASGQSGQIPLPGVARRLSPGPSGTVVVEIERQGGDQYGAPANFWLFPLPTPATALHQTPNPRTGR